MVRSRDSTLLLADGARLVSRVWHPDGDGPWPVLVMRQPYGRAIASTVTYAHPSWYAGHGFLVVVQDVRGRGASDGCFAGFAQEAADGAATVRWARTLAGSNGRVGSYGFSYQGLTQLLNSGDDDAALPDCLSPAMCGLDERLHWASEGGAHWWALGLGWALQLAAEGCRRRGDGAGWGEIRRSLQQGQFCDEGLALLERHDPAGMGLRWLKQDPSIPKGWTVHTAAPALLRRPMLLIGGWHDPHLTGVLDLWIRARAAGGSPGLVVGAWNHLDWNGGLDSTLLAFFRRHLQDPLTPPGAPQAETEAPIRLQCCATGTWHNAGEPSEPQGAAIGWSLHSEGLAAIRCDEGELRPAAAPAGGGLVVLVHDPWRPAPGRGGHLGPAPGPVERADLDRRSDVACFSTAPLAHDLWLLGTFHLQLRVSADQSSFDLCAALSEVSPDGRSVRQLTTGVARFGPGEAAATAGRSLALQPLATLVAAGQRLRLSVAAAAWPLIAVNPGDGSLPAGGSGPGHRVISLTLDLADSRLGLEPLIRAN
ncbi:CocE/NonD family hydrolase [Cyanobium sp. Cruz CV13-4-11]|uniref:CocE/NonD family hydrolase n=1 Tax=unclassified Cyanobium TaxID=2627006 RepID=UPI0020CE57F4|nr:MULTISPECIES: CocE/NonD family hydrolase [unclassified Cyanobium]MCP9899974.1 CocE/NonD family hydrolase [Cyanobium sp. Cruz CV11-17]MCP9919005.1 CocE/NonD family hydrolase [Cyanobium sp. Cruz CV13-4-11]